MPKARKKTLPKAPPKYQFEENGETKYWSGRGRAPKPIDEALKAGRSLDEFLIKKDLPALLVTKSNIISLWFTQETFFDKQEDVLSLTLPLMYFQTCADLSKITHHEVHYQDGFVQQAWLQPEIQLFVVCIARKKGSRREIKGG